MPQHIPGSLANDYCFLYSEMETVNKQVANFVGTPVHPAVWLSTDSNAGSGEQREQAATAVVTAAAPKSSTPPRSAAPQMYSQEAPRSPPKSPPRQFECMLHPSEAALICSRFSQYVPSVMSKMDHDGFTKFLVEGFAHSFFSREAFEHSCQNVRAPNCSKWQGRCELNYVWCCAGARLDLLGASAPGARHSICVLQKVLVDTQHK